MNPQDRAVVLGAGLPTAVAGLVSVVVAGLAAGRDGAVGALAGTVVVLLFFGLGQLVVGRAFRSSPQTAMNAALLVYVVSLLVLLLLVAAFKDTTLFDTRAFGLTVVACTLVWTVFHLRALVRHRVLYADPDSPGRG